MGFLNRLLGKETVHENKNAVPLPQKADTPEEEADILACISAVAAYLMNNDKNKNVITRCQENTALIWSFAGRQETMNSKRFLKKN